MSHGLCSTFSTVPPKQFQDFREILNSYSLKFLHPIWGFIKERPSITLFLIWFIIFYCSSTVHTKLSNSDHSFRATVAETHIVILENVTIGATRLTTSPNSPVLCCLRGTLNHRLWLYTADKEVCDQLTTL